MGLPHPCLKAVLAGLLLLVWTGAAYAQTAPPLPESGRPLLQNFAPEDYDGHSQNWSVAQDDRGLVYVANGSFGVLEYDGHAWRVIDVGGAFVRTVLRAPDGTILVGGRDAIGYLAPDSTGALAYASLLDQIDPALRDFGHAWSGAVTSDAAYFVTNDVLFRWDGQRFHTWQNDSAASNAFFYRSFVVRDTLYVSHRGEGLRRVVGDSLGWAPGGQQFADDRIHFLLDHGDGRLLLAKNDDGLFLYDGRQLERFEAEAQAFFEQQMLNVALRLPGGTYALGTLRGGLLHMDARGRTLQVYDKTTGLVDDDIKRLFLDREGGLWLAMEAGLARAQLLATASIFDTPMGLEGAVYALKRHRGTLYAGTSKGLFRLVRRAEPDGRARHRFERVGGITIEIRALETTPRALLATSPQGLYVVDGSTAQTIPDTYAAITLHASAQHPDQVYVGHRDGLSVVEWEAGRWRVTAKIRAIDDEEIHHLYEDEAGSLWIGSFYGGLWRIGETAVLSDETPVQYFAPEEGYPAVVRQLVRYEGGLRVITDAAMLQPAFDETGTVTLQPDTTLQAVLGAHAPLNTVQHSGEGLAWIFTDEDVHRIGPDGEGGWQVTRPLEQVPFWPTYASLLEPDGTFWMGGAKGLLRHTATSPLPTLPPFETLLRRVSVLTTDSVLFGGGMAAAAPPRLRPTHNALRFAYTTPLFDYAKTPPAYQVLLDGFDADWSALAAETQKDYTNLPPGSYRFRVRARDAAGRESAEAVYAFAIAPPWHQTPWAYAGYLLLGLGLLYGLVHGTAGWRSAQLQRRNEQLEATVAARTAEVEAHKAQLEDHVAALQAQERALHALNDELRLTNDALWKADEAKTYLLGMAAHDLRDPLTGIRGLAQSLLEDFDVPGEHDEFVALIHASAQSMLDMIGDLLDSVAIESGTIALDRQTLDVAKLAEWVVHGFRPQAAAKQQTLLFQAPQNGRCLAEADAGRLREAMTNLLSNAIKYSPPGTPIDVEVYAEGEACYFAVRDHGPGLSAADQARLFQPFQRLAPQPTGGEPSTGLGLFIVQQLMDLHGGRVFAESMEDVGSTFTLSLPLANGQAENSAA